MYIDLTLNLLEVEMQFPVGIWLKISYFKNRFDKYKSKSYSENTVEREVPTTQIVHITHIKETTIVIQ